MKYTNRPALDGIDCNAFGLPAGWEALCRPKDWASFDLPAGWKPFDPEELLGLAQMGLVPLAQRFHGGRVDLWCRPRVQDGVEYCTSCGARGVSKGWYRRWFSHVPLGLTPLRLLVEYRRFYCQDCKRSWGPDLSTVGPAAHRLTDAAVDFALRMIVLARASIKALSRLLAVEWHTVNEAIMDKARSELFNDPARFGGVEVIGALNTGGGTRAMGMTGLA